MRLLFLLILTAFPAVSMATGLFQVAPTDKSMQYLGMIFGAVGGLPISPPVGAGVNTTFSQLLYTFNEVVFALSIIILSYTGLVGLVSTAHEGEVLGKKWSVIWIPVRGALGLYLLLPTTTNYNWIQIAMMWFIVQGVGAANALWTQVIYSITSQGGLHTSNSTATLDSVLTTVNGIFYSELCMNMLNQNTQAAAMLGENIVAYTYTDNGGNAQVQFGRLSQQGLEAPLCGAVTMPSQGGSVTNIISGTTDPGAADRTQIYSDAVVTAQATLDSPSQEALNLPSASWSLANAFVTAAQGLQSAAASTSTTFASLSSVNQQAILDGWIMAGSYYFTLITTTGVNAGVVSYSITAPDTNHILQLLGPTLGSQILSSLGQKATAYENYVQTDPGIQSLNPATAYSGSMFQTSPSMNSSLQKAYHDLFGNFWANLAQKITDTMHSGGITGDPLIAMATFGSYLTATTEIVFWSALVTLVLLGAATAFCSVLNPAAAVYKGLLNILLPIASIMLLLLWSAGIMMALYIPLIPYIVFTFSALTWFIVVIEAMLGAPLIALSLIIPSEDEVGKAGASVVLMLGLFLRPGLMILGFIFAAQIVIVAIGMLGYGFYGALIGNTYSIGLFGMVAVICLYAAIATTLVHESFSLIYVLPDKILRWMGGQPEGQEIAGMLGKAKGGAEAGAAAGKATMSAGFSKMSSSQKGMK